MNNLPYLYGEPNVHGDLRSEMADFKVFELLPFTASGEGEHLFIHLQKTGVNTVFVARMLAKFFSVKEHAVSYAGLKDRFAVCQQYFSVHLPGNKSVDLSQLSIEGVEVLSAARHNKKLKTGTLLGNRFELILKNVTDIEVLNARWQQIIEHGVPNYFGEQRFGIEAGNLTRAKELFAGKKVKDKKKRGFYLSAARSFLFNQFVANRIENESFASLQPGDVCMLAGTQSVFLAEQVDQALINRLQQGDIDLTAPMWGRGQLMSKEDVQALEQNIADQHQEFAQGLEMFGLKQERRRIRLRLSTPKLEPLNENKVKVSFCLPAGCFATTIMRELLQYQDLTERKNANLNEHS